MKLDEYRQKRHFGATPEPKGARNSQKKTGESLIYAIQKHMAFGRAQRALTRSGSEEPPRQQPQLVGGSVNEAEPQPKPQMVIKSLWPKSRMHPLPAGLSIE